jgi:Uma2 family endonuclease
MRVSPSANPEHSWIVHRLINLLEPYIFRNKLGRMYGDVDVPLGALDVRRPDLLFYSTGRLALTSSQRLQGPPDLCIEVLSPSSVKIDRQDKFELYLKAGVAFYWIVDPVARTIEAFAARGGAWDRAGLGRDTQTINLPPFAALEIPLADLWHPED